MEREIVQFQTGEYAIREKYDNNLVYLGLRDIEKNQTPFRWSHNGVGFSHYTSDNLDYVKKMLLRLETLEAIEADRKRKQESAYQYLFLWRTAADGGRHVLCFKRFI